MITILAFTRASERRESGINNQSCHLRAYEQKRAAKSFSESHLLSLHSVFSGTCENFNRELPLVAQLLLLLLLLSHLTISYRLCRAVYILTTDDDEVVVVAGWIDRSDSFAELGNFFLGTDERVQQGHECQELRSGTGLSEARPEVWFRTGRRDWHFVRHSTRNETESQAGLSRHLRLVAVGDRIDTDSFALQYEGTRSKFHKYLVSII